MTEVEIFEAEVKERLRYKEDADLVTMFWSLSNDQIYKVRSH